MNTRQQGDIGELSAALWFTKMGVPVYLPVAHSPDYDMVIEVLGSLSRVQVKTSRAHHNGVWRVTLCTRGGNQSWSGITKKFGPDRCDYLFAHVGDGRRWLIPANFVEATTAVVLGGRRYAQFEIERGEPLRAETPSKSPLQSRA